MPPTHVPGSVPVDGGTERAVGHDGGMHAAEFILYVADQARARDWWAATLDNAPSLDVPGMTEFDLDGATLGLMPAAGITALIGDGLRVGDGQRCEVYLPGLAHVAWPDGGGRARWREARGRAHSLCRRRGVGLGTWAWGVEARARRPRPRAAGLETVSRS